MKKQIACAFWVLLLMALSACEAASATTKSTPPVKGSAAQIVAYYNDHANALKAAERITVEKREVREGSIQTPPSMDETVIETFVEGKGVHDASLTLNDFLPVHGKPHVSDLIASAVQSAACVEQGDGWLIEIATEDESFCYLEEQGIIIDFFLSNGFITATINTEGKVTAMTHHYDCKEITNAPDTSTTREQSVFYEYQFTYGTD